jgi:Tol biopolymer transport system component
VIPAAIAVAYFTWSLRQRPAPPATPMRAVPLVALPGIKRFPSFSPDGNHVAFTWTGPGQNNQDVYVQQIGAGRELRLTTAEAADSAPVWSPDGRSIAFLRQTSVPRLQELRLIPPLGGPERKLTEIRPRGFLRAVTMAWCPDSTCLLVTDGQGGEKPDALFVVSTETREKRQLTQPPAENLADTDPAISPDGRWLAFRRDVAPFSGQLQVVALGSDLTLRGEPRQITPVLLTAYGPKWVSNDEGSTPERLPVGEDGLGPAVSPPLSDGTRRLAYPRSYSDLNIWRIDTSAPGVPASAPPVLAIASTRRDALAHLSTDGKRITFMSDRSGESEVPGDSRLQFFSFATRRVTTVASKLGTVAAVISVTRDGRTIFFSRVDSATDDLMLVENFR